MFEIWLSFLFPIIVPFSLLSFIDIFLFYRIARWQPLRMGILLLINFFIVFFLWHIILALFGGPHKEVLFSFFSVPIILFIAFSYKVLATRSRIFAVLAVVFLVGIFFCWGTYLYFTFFPPVYFDDVSVIPK